MKITRKTKQAKTEEHSRSLRPIWKPVEVSKPHCPKCGSLLKYGSELSPDIRTVCSYICSNWKCSYIY